MHTFLTRSLGLLLCCLSWVSVWAGDGIVVSHAWARATPPGSQVGAVYLRIENSSHRPAEFVSVSTSVATKAEFHDIVIDADVMKMQHLPSVVVPMHGDLTFTPGSQHIMLKGLEAPLVAGESFELMLDMDDGTTLQVMVMVADSQPMHEHDAPIAEPTEEHDHSE